MGDSDRRDRLSSQPMASALLSSMGFPQAPSGSVICSGVEQWIYQNAVMQSTLTFYKRDQTRRDDASGGQTTFACLLALLFPPLNIIVVHSLCSASPPTNSFHILYSQVRSSLQPARARVRPQSIGSRIKKKASCQLIN